MNFCVFISGLKIEFFPRHFLVMATIELIEKLKEAKMRGGVRKWQILQKGIFD